MARSRTPEAISDNSDVEVAESIIEAENSSANGMVSDNPPNAPSSIERSFPPARPLPKFWIELPPLPKDYDAYSFIKVPRLRKPEEDAASEPDEETSRVPVKLVGEVEQNETKYYYAEVEGGIITKFTADSVQDKYPRLVQIYKRKLKDNTLPPFDPSSTKVHPRHRIKIHVKPPQRSTNNKTRASTRSSTPRGRSEDDDVVSVSSDSSNSVSEGDSVPVRQSTRLAALPKEKRFSPRKARNLRSGRKRDGASTSSATEIHSDSGSAYEVRSSESEEQHIKPIRLKRPTRKRDTIKGLGIVRSIDDPADSDSDTGEGAVLLRHRERCERCGDLPAHKLLEALKRRKGKKKGSGRRKKGSDDSEESEPEDERIERLGGWIRCLHCCVSGHWGCLSGTQRQEVQFAARAHENELKKVEMRAEGEEVADDAMLVEKRKEIWLDETTEFVCTACARGAPCIVCKEDTTPEIRPQLIALSGGASAGDAIDLATPPPEGKVQIQPATPAPNENNAAPSSPKSSAKPLSTVKPGELLTSYAPANIHQVLFRCKNCRRPAHWQHLPARDPKDESQRTALQIAAVYQERGPDQWKCHDCVRWTYSAESILAWRPDPPGAVETLARGEVPKPKDPLRREYLVKFKERGFRRVEWVPHMWLLSMHEGLLRNFLKSGTKVPLLEDESEEFQQKIGEGQKVDAGKGKTVEKNGALDVLPVFARSRSASAEGGEADQHEYEGTPGPMPDAPQRIPDAWLRIDRLLDAVLVQPQNGGKKITQFMKRKSHGKAKKKRVDSEDDELVSDSEEDNTRVQFVDGEPPDPDMTETMRDFELRMGRKIKVKELMERAVWVYLKFEGLQYDDCAWDTPPRPGSLEWDSYKQAVPRYVFAQSVEVPKLTKEEERKRDNRPWREISYWAGQDLQPKLEDKSLSLMPFQVQGLQWLYGNWHNLQPSILADDMGLGKTVQLVSLIGKLVSEHVFPHLIVVPNSTIVNWVREFERWVPHVRVVRFNGEAKGREVIKKTELWNSDGKQMYHALVTTYETLAGAEFQQVFKKPGRWETVVVDEGQRLKSDSSLLFRKLTELKTIHRILMTGTPLNNNIRELFNLMNFLDPKEWNNLDQLEKEYDQENLTEELIAKLHERLRPYFLRRQKAEVLDLPDKHEVIVPVSLAPIQKDIMRAILEANLSTLGLFVDKNLRETRKGPGPKKSSLHNVLMEMRKCIQHPYLNQADMERRGLSQEETLKQLVDASAKFRLLKLLLPQLKKRGHRVLLFSQFKIVLDIVEDFLVMEGYKLLRLDGDTKSSLRQKEIDEFNKPGSDYFIYILTTRAGGVGVNLWSADTVIVFDPDFNPHQDLQAIARAHRYGQTKRVLVFKFMAKNTAEEKIFMMGKKKLVLDHLIVQKLGDEDEMDDIQGILTHGAKALFENTGESASDIKYTEHDIEELITRAETEQSEEKKSSEGGMKFDFAQVWDRGQGTKTDIPDDTQDATADEDFWAGVIKRAGEEKAKKRAQELTGRGARKRAIAVCSFHRSPRPS
ncbi:hypothetical protein BDV93DRAFT_141687 [Ceratobasidium sp. AG-I]|nr:hypothetical protein BDV93DRAFT_141687 [Ceratobasidium sp. AG-I]